MKEPLEDGTECLKSELDIDILFNNVKMEGCESAGAATTNQETSSHKLMCHSGWSL
jgi:hypothetical protein